MARKDRMNLIKLGLALVIEKSLSTLVSILHAASYEGNFSAMPSRRK